VPGGAPNFIYLFLIYVFGKQPYPVDLALKIVDLPSGDPGKSKATRIFVLQLVDLLDFRILPVRGTSHARKVKVTVFRTIVYHLSWSDTQWHQQWENRNKRRHWNKFLSIFDKPVVIPCLNSRLQSLDSCRQCLKHRKRINTFTYVYYTHVKLQIKYK